MTIKKYARRIINLPTSEFDFFCVIDWEGEKGTCFNPYVYLQHDLIDAKGCYNSVKDLLEEWTLPLPLTVVRYDQYVSPDAPHETCEAKINHLNFALEYGQHFKNSIGVEFDGTTIILALEKPEPLNNIWNDLIIPILGPTCDIEG